MRALRFHQSRERHSIDIANANDDLERLVFSEYHTMGATTGAFDDTERQLEIHLLRIYATTALQLN